MDKLLCNDTLTNLREILYAMCPKFHSFALRTQKLDSRFHFGVHANLRLLSTLSPHRSCTAVDGVIFVTWSMFKVHKPYPIKKEAFRRSNKLRERAVAFYASIPKLTPLLLLPPSPPLWKQTNLSYLSLPHFPGNA